MTKKLLNQFSKNINKDIQKFLTQKDIDNKDHKTKTNKIKEFINYLIKNKTDSKTECYLEAGIFVGETLISAAHGHDVLCYGIDNFHMKCKGEDGEIKLKDNLNKADLKNIEYQKITVNEFFEKNKNVNGKKVKVYMYDAGHSYQDTYEGIIKAKDILANEAYVLIHDTGATSNTAPLKAVNDVLDKEKEFSLIEHIGHSEDWPCGLSVLFFNRKE